ncbi:MAG TPA: DUF1735 domain-containing protein [Bacteroidales bacterium]|nr:DUF1735 domain-containing protein [Bacteroidales bacterium]
MNKRILYLVLAVALILTSCYDDYIHDYNYTSVYFPYQTDVRTFVVGEGMTINVGVVLGGTIDNDKDRVINYLFDNSLITPAVLSGMKNNSLPYIKQATASVSTLLPLPSNYFTISDNSKMVIKAGMHAGSVTIKVDSLQFLSDPATLNATYALPFLITAADADSIITAKKYAIIGVKYENMLFGNYWHGGVTIVKDAAGNNIDTIIYRTTIPSPESKIWSLTTTSPNTLITNGYSDKTNSKMVLALDGNNITITPNAGSSVAISGEGQSTFNRSKLLQDRKLYLNYQYSDGAGNTYHAKDTLIFRNRIRDGVNEWQDEHPGNY